MEYVSKIGGLTQAETAKGKVEKSRSGGADKRGKIIHAKSENKRHPANNVKRKNCADRHLTASERQAFSKNLGERETSADQFPQREDNVGEFFKV